MIAGTIAFLVVIYFVVLPIQALCEAKFASPEDKRLMRLRTEEQARNLPPWRQKVRKWLLS